MCEKWEAEPDLRVAEFRHSLLVLNRDQFFPGYLFLFTREHVTELFHLSPKLRGELMEEVSKAARALHIVFAPDKINYELIGNMVPHMHWHLVPRFTGDPLWPRPIWAEPHQEKLLTPSEYAVRISLIRRALSEAL